MNAPFDRRARPFVIPQPGLGPKLYTPHVMRHTAITQIAQAGIDVPIIRKISGHKTTSMVLHFPSRYQPGPGFTVGAFLRRAGALAA